MKTKGVSTKKIEKIGNHSSDTAMVFFEDVVVPRKNIIGEEGKGFTYQMLQFQEERMWGTMSGERTGVSSMAVLPWRRCHFCGVWGSCVPQTRTDLCC